MDIYDRVGALRPLRGILPLGQKKRLGFKMADFQQGQEQAPGPVIGRGHGNIVPVFRQPDAVVGSRGDASVIEFSMR